MSNREIQLLILALQTKLSMLPYH